MSAVQDRTTPSATPAPVAVPDQSGQEPSSLPTAPRPRIRAIRIKSALAPATLYIAAEHMPQLTVTLSDQLLDRVFKSIGNRTVSNVQLAGILDAAIPGLAASMASATQRSFAYSYSRARDAEKVQLRDAAMVLHRFWRAKGKQHRFNLTLEIADPKFDRALTAQPGDSRRLEQLKARLARVEADYDRRRAANPALPAVNFGAHRKALVRAFDLAAAGKRPPIIAESLGLPRTTINSWLGGKLVLPMSKHPHGVNVQRKAAGDFDLSALTADDQAYLLGAYLACHQGRTRIGRGKIELTGNKQTVTRLATVIAPGLSGEQVPRALKRGRSDFCRISSVPFQEKLEHLTNRGRLIPPAIVATESGCLEFLRAYLGCKHYTNASALILSKDGNPELLVQLAGVFERLGVLPVLRGSPPGSLAVVDVAGFKRLIELKVFSKKTDLAAVRTLARRPSELRIYTADEYASVIALLPEYTAGQIGFAEISRTTGVSASTVLSWILNGKKPNVVRRQEALVAARREYRIAELL